MYNNKKNQTFFHIHTWIPVNTQLYLKTQKFDHIKDT